MNAVTPKFAAPEQLNGGNASLASEVWQVSLLAYELLTGQLPEQIDQIPLCSQAVRAQKSLLALGIHMSAKQYGNQLRGNIDAIISKGLRLNPSDRYRDVAERAQDLSRTLASPHARVSARNGERWYRSKTWILAHRWIALFASTALLAIVIGSYGTWRYAVKAEQLAKASQALNQMMLDIFLTQDRTQVQESTSIRGF